MLQRGENTNNIVLLYHSAASSEIGRRIDGEIYFFVVRVPHLGVTHFTSFHVIRQITRLLNIRVRLHVSRECRTRGKAFGIQMLR